MGDHRLTIARDYSQCDYNHVLTMNNSAYFESRGYVGDKLHHCDVTLSVVKVFFCIFVKKNNHPLSNCLRSSCGQQIA